VLSVATMPAFACLVLKVVDVALIFDPC